MANELRENNDATQKREKNEGGLNPARMALGMAVGVVLGIALDNLAVGIVIGGGLGLAFNVAMGQRDRQA